MTLTTCTICDGKQDAMREHCKYCGARRVFIARHTSINEDYLVIVKACDWETRREIVRAFATTFCKDERRQLEGRDSE